MRESNSTVNLFNVLCVGCARYLRNGWISRDQGELWRVASPRESTGIELRDKSMRILRAAAIIAHRNGRAFLVRYPLRNDAACSAKRTVGSWKDQASCLSQTPPFSLRALSEESIILRRFDGIPERKSRAAEDLSLIYGSRYFVASWAASDVEETISYIPTYLPT